MNGIYYSLDELYADDSPCQNCGEPAAIHDDGDCPDGVSAGYLPSA